MHILSYLPAIIGVPFAIVVGFLLRSHNNSETRKKGQTAAFIALLVLCVGIFAWEASLLGRGAGSPHLDAKYNATPTCAPLKGRAAGFFDTCTGDWQVLGVRGEKVTMKCCTRQAFVEVPSDIPTSAPKPPAPSNTTTPAPPNSTQHELNTSEDVVELPPGLAAIPYVNEKQYKDPDTARQFLAVCPRLIGDIIPQGFLAMAVSSVVGTIIMLFLNSIRGCCDSEDFALNMRILLPGRLGTLKTIVSVLAGMASSGLAAGYDGRGWWDKYQIFCAMVVNGAVAQNLVDFLVFLIMSHNFGNFDKNRHLVSLLSTLDEGIQQEQAKPLLDTLIDMRDEVTFKERQKRFYESDFFKRSVLFLLVSTVILVAPLFSHWFGGFALFFFPTVVVIAAVELVGRIIGYNVEGAVSCVSLGWARSLRYIIRLMALNFELMVLIRFPFNLALFVTGASTYPYFNSTEDVLDPAAWLEAPFYLIQMGSFNCYMLRAYTSVNHLTNIILTVFL